MECILKHAMMRGGFITTVETMDKKIFAVTLSVFSLFLFFYSPAASGQASAPAASAPVPKPRMRMDSVLASVNGDAITLLDVMLESIRQERELAAMYTGERLYSEIARLRKKTLEEIIERRLVYQEFKRNSFEIPVQDIENMLDSLAREMGASDRASLERKAVQYGTTLDELRAKARERIAVDAMLGVYCDRLVTVTPREVYEEYTAHPERWAAPATIDLQLIQLKQGLSEAETLSAADRLSTLLKGVDAAGFSAKAAEYSSSTDANAAAVTRSERSKLRPEFAEALKDAAASAIIGPVKTPEGLYFIRVDSVKASELVPFSGAEEVIRRDLTYYRNALKRAEYIGKLRNKSFVRYLF